MGYWCHEVIHVVNTLQVCRLSAMPLA